MMIIILSKDKTFVIALNTEKIKILEQLSLKENKSIDKIINEIIEKSLMN